MALGYPSVNLYPQKLEAEKQVASMPSAFRSNSALHLADISAQQLHADFSLLQLCRLSGCRRLRLFECCLSSGEDLVVVRIRWTAVERATSADSSTRTMLRANHERVSTLIAFDAKLQLMVIATICSINETDDGVEIWHCHSETF